MIREEPSKIIQKMHQSEYPLIRYMGACEERFGNQGKSINFMEEQLQLHQQHIIALEQKVNRIEDRGIINKIKKFWRG